MDEQVARFFCLENGRFESTVTVDTFGLGIFESMVQELIDFRLAQYLTRSETVPATEVQNNVVAMSSEGTELPFFPTLKIACGHFRNSRVDAIEDVEYRSLGNGYGRLNPEKHFIAKASGNSMNGGKNPIHDGDYLLSNRSALAAAGKSLMPR